MLLLLLLPSLLHRVAAYVKIVYLKMQTSNNNPFWIPYYCLVRYYQNVAVVVVVVVERDRRRKLIKIKKYRFETIYFVIHFTNSIHWIRMYRFVVVVALLNSTAAHSRRSNAGARAHTNKHSHTHTHVQRDTNAHTKCL